MVGSVPEARNASPAISIPGVSGETPAPGKPPIEELPAGGDEMPFRAPTDPHEERER